jgi:hypothetical protein
LQFVFLAFVSVVFAISLWKNNLNRFHNVGAPVAIHGRYWAQILPIILVLFVLGFKFTLDRLPAKIQPKIASAALIIALLAFMQGGGITSFILISDASWYWPDKPIVELNQKARSVLSKIIIH